MIAFVDRFAQQERRGDAEDRADHDQPQQQTETHPVGDEQPSDPSQGDRRPTRPGDVLGAGLWLPGATSAAPPPPPCPCEKG